MTKCRLCGSESLEKAFSLENMPNNISVLYRSLEECNKQVPITYDIYQCSDCSFIQAKDCIDSEYYDEYVMTVTHSRTMDDYQRIQAKDFVSTYNLAGKNIIEVGCGDGNFMGHLRANGVNVFGIEPSQNFRKMSQDKGYEIYAGFVTQESLIPGAPYDGFVTREVLEHVMGVNSFLKGIYNSLKPGAIGLVEVPCMEKTFENNRFYDFFPDHVNYFTEYTLKHAVTRNGFTVLDFFYGMNKEYINIIVRKDAVPEFSCIKSIYNKLNQELNSLVETCNSKGLKVGVWGSGAKGITVMATSRVKNIECVIDSDSNKVGRYTPVSGFIVVSPDSIMENKIDVIIITAMAYKDEIMEELINTYAFQGIIAVLGDGIDILPK